jgi:hypothetical protein
MPRRVDFAVFEPSALLSDTLAGIVSYNFGNSGMVLKPGRSSSFVRDQNRPFVYSESDHIGVGVRRAAEEPSTRIWLKFVNNCSAPICLRVYGVPDSTTIARAKSINFTGRIVLATNLRAIAGS